MLAKAIFNHKSELTPYGFTCGFIQEKGGVKLYTNKGEKLYNVYNSENNFWNSYSSLIEARKVYNKQIELNRGKFYAK